MKINKIITVILTSGTLLFSGFSQAAIITFDTLVMGETSFGYDGDGDLIDDVIFSTTDPGGYNTAGPGPDMSYINEPGLEGTTSLSPDLRVDFLNGAIENITFGFAEIVLGNLTFSIFDNTNAVLATDTVASAFTTLPDSSSSAFPEALVDLDFEGIASYALFDFALFGDEECEVEDDDQCFGRYIIDNFAGTFGSTEDIPPQTDPIPAVPVPAAFWLFGTALIGFIGFSRRTKVG